MAMRAAPRVVSPCGITTYGDEIFFVFLTFFSR
jgi:hypothetical protein